MPIRFTHILFSVAAIALVQSCRPGNEKADKSAAHGKGAMPDVPSMDPRRCGNGELDRGEACDPAMEFQEGCPDGWGVCQTCLATCRWGFDFSKHATLVRSRDQSHTYHGNYQASYEYDRKGRRTHYRRIWQPSDTKPFHEVADEGEDLEKNANGTLYRSWKRPIPGVAVRGQEREIQRNTAGLVTSERIHISDPKGDHRSETFFEHDTKGRLIREWSDDDGKGQATREMRHTYNALGLTSLEEFKRGRRWARWEYNKKTGSPVRWTWLNADRASERTRFEYDARGRLALEWHDFDGDGRPDRRVHYECNKQGKMTRERTHTRADVDPQSDIRYEYDKHGKLVRKWEARPDGKPERETRYKYNAQGLLEETTSSLNSGEHTFLIR